MKHIIVDHDIRLRLADLEDATLIHEMKFLSFEPLYQKYQDHDTSPATEKLDKVIDILKQDFTDYYIIEFQENAVGAIRVRLSPQNQGVIYIAPVFIIPQYQNMGIMTKSIHTVMKQYPDAVTWRLDTILQEEGNCHLYEKLGFVRIGEVKEVNDLMSLVKYEKVNVEVRRFEEKDVDEVSDLIVRNFMEVNIKDYGKDAMEEMARTHDANWVLEVASFANLYVFIKDQQIIASGGISSFWGSPDESIILIVFVLPKYHGKGIGRKIMQTLEEDEVYKRAKRVEIPASITACDFYHKFGYEFKNGVKELDDEGHYRMEKFKNIIDNSTSSGMCSS